MFEGFAKYNRELINDGSSRGRFEKDVDETIGELIRGSDANAEAFWASLANNCWAHPDFPEQGVSYSFRAAGVLIASIRKKGDYMDWYCCRSDYPTVAEWILDALTERGWIPEYVNGEE